MAEHYSAILIKTLDASILSLNGELLKFSCQFIYHGSNISSTESQIKMRIETTWNANGLSSILWKSNLSDLIKLNTLTENRDSSIVWQHHLDSSRRMLRTVLKKSGKQLSISQQLYGHLPPIS